MKTEQIERNHEQRIRRLAARHGYRVVKSRLRDIQKLHLNDQGDHMLVENARNYAVLGWNYDASLKEIEQYFQD